MPGGAVGGGEAEASGDEVEHAGGEGRFAEDGFARGVEGRDFPGEDLVQHQPEGPDVHLLKTQLEQVLGQDYVFLHFGSVVVEAGLELSQLLLDFVCD